MPLALADQPTAVLTAPLALALVPQATAFAPVAVAPSAVPDATSWHTNCAWALSGRHTNTAVKSRAATAHLGSVRIDARRRAFRAWRVSTPRTVRFPVGDDGNRLPDDTSVSTDPTNRCALFNIACIPPTRLESRHLMGEPARRAWTRPKYKSDNDEDSLLSSRLLSKRHEPPADWLKAKKVRTKMKRQIFPATKNGSRAHSLDLPIPVPPYYFPDSVA